MADNTSDATDNSAVQEKVQYTTTELLDLIRSVPEEQGMELVRKHWPLLFPKDPGIALGGAYDSLLPHHGEAWRNCPVRAWQLGLNPADVDWVSKADRIVEKLNAKGRKDCAQAQRLGITMSELEKRRNKWGILWPLARWLGWS